MMSDSVHPGYRARRETWNLQSPGSGQVRLVTLYETGPDGQLMTLYISNTSVWPVTRRKQLQAA